MPHNGTQAYNLLIESLKAEIEEKQTILSELCTPDVTALDEKCIMALILGVIRADRFCEGTLLYFFENGIIDKWLLQLKSIDTNKESLD